MKGAEIWKLFRSGKSTIEIAKDLNISEARVYRELNNILDRLHEKKGKEQAAGRVVTDLITPARARPIDFTVPRFSPNVGVRS